MYSACVLIILYEPDMYPKGSPKYNMSQLSAKKKASPKIRKKSSPKGIQNIDNSTFSLINGYLQVISFSGISGISVNYSCHLVSL